MFDATVQNNATMTFNANITFSASITLTTACLWMSCVVLATLLVKMLLDTYFPKGGAANPNLNNTLPAGRELVFSRNIALPTSLPVAKICNSCKGQLIGPRYAPRSCLYCRLCVQLGVDHDHSHCELCHSHHFRAEPQGS